MTSSDSPPTSSTAAPLRASTAEREHAARLIHEAAGQGMLTLSETEERLSSVYAARFRDELAPLVADLPVEPQRADASMPGWVPAGLVALLGRLLEATAGPRAFARDFARRHRVWATLIVIAVAALVLAVVLGAVGDLFGGGEHGIEQGFGDGAREGADLEGAR